MEQRLFVDQQNKGVQWTDCIQIIGTTLVLVYQLHIEHHTDSMMISELRPVQAINVGGGCVWGDGRVLAMVEHARLIEHPPPSTKPGKKIGKEKT